MKKLLYTVILGCSSIIFASAQTPYDALRYSQTDITGTARYTSMAGAFGALGGDASAIKDNPAGLGIFRKSELSTTINIMSQTSSSTWGNTKSQSDLYKLGFNTLSYIIASPTWRNETGRSGLLFSNWSFSYNKLKDFNRRSYIRATNQTNSLTDYIANFSGTTPSGSYDFNNYPTSEYNSPWDNEDISWLSIMGAYGYLMYQLPDLTWTSFLGTNGETISPKYIINESGAINEYSFGWSGNFSNKFFLGLNLNIRSIDYLRSTSYTEEYSTQGSMQIRNNFSTTGSGLNLKIGAIYTPVDYLRLGLSYHSPSMLYLSDANSIELDFNTSEGYGNIYSPSNSLTYQVLTPEQISASIGFILGNKGLISAEYVYNDYRANRFYEEDGSIGSYEEENQRISEYLNNSRTIKIGGEYRLTDNFSLRAGYANTSGATKSGSSMFMIPNTTRGNTEYFLHNSTNYITAGIGYRDSNWFIDAAYVNKINNETFYPYSNSVTPDHLDAPAASVITSTGNIVLSLGLRF